MIWLYTGTPGSGKSLHAARVIVDRLRHGRPVIANFEINPSTRGYDNFIYLDNNELTPEFLMSFAHSYFKDGKVREEEITVIFDEAQIVFNSRDWDAKRRMAWIKFFSQHRHFGYRVILVVQNDRMLDRQIRTLAEYECQHRKLANYGLWGWFLSHILGMGQELFCCVNVYYGLRDRLDADWFRGSQRLYDVYDTYHMFDGSAA